MSVVVGPTEDIAACRVLRHEVFVLEQGVSVADEVDDRDGVALHLLATVDGAAMGTARMLFDGETAKIGRVCVRKAARGTGLGVALIEEAVVCAGKRDGITKVKLGAQVHALGFYEALGFVAFGPVFDDAGIDHRDMLREI